MELYDKKFVYFEWDDKLDDKKGFVAQNIASLKSQVNYGTEAMVTLSSSDDDTCPFTYYDVNRITCDYPFAYYDPYYEFRKAYLEGKQLQFKDGDDWVDIDGEPCFIGDEYRIKPETMYYVEYFNNHIAKMTSPTLENVLFQSTNEFEIDRFIYDHEYLGDVIKAAREGKKIQFKEFGVSNDPWKESTGWDDLSQHDFVHYEYRIDECTECLKHNMCDTPGKRCKSYCTKIEYVPFDSVQELIDAWDNKYPQNKNRPEGTMPFIWIKNKQKNRVYLITDFLFEKLYERDDIGTEDCNLELKELFDDYTFTDGTVIGKVKEE